MMFHTAAKPAVAGKRAIWLTQRTKQLLKGQLRRQRWRRKDTYIVDFVRVATASAEEAGSLKVEEPLLEDVAY